MHSQEGRFEKERIEPVNFHLIRDKRFLNKWLAVYVNDDRVLLIKQNLHTIIKVFLQIK